MVYNINNRFLFRGFHPCLEGKDKITKPDGKVVRGTWIAGALQTIPMPTPPGAAAQMPVLCLARAEKRMDGIAKNSVCACTISLFSGTRVFKDWETLPKSLQQKWLGRGKKVSEWIGWPIFEGDLFYDKQAKQFCAVTFDLLGGFRLVQEDGYVREWSFEGLSIKGTLWNPCKDFPAAWVAKLHKDRNTEARVEEITF